MNKLFKLYVAIMLLLIVLLLASIVGGLVYVGKQVNSEANKATAKINNLNQSLGTLNIDLNNLKAQVQSNTDSLNSTLKP